MVYAIFQDQLATEMYNFVAKKTDLNKCLLEVSFWNDIDIINILINVNVVWSFFNLLLMTILAEIMRHVMTNKLFLNTISITNHMFMYSENPKGTRIIVGSVNLDMIYLTPHKESNSQPCWSQASAAAQIPLDHIDEGKCLFEGNYLPSAQHQIDGQLPCKYQMSTLWCWETAV